MYNNYTQGRLAQLVERLPYKEDVGSSSLSTPTIKRTTQVVLFFIALFGYASAHKLEIQRCTWIYYVCFARIIRTARKLAYD